jgi:hypothetical protein
MFFLRVGTATHEPRVDPFRPCGAQGPAGSFCPQAEPVGPLRVPPIQNPIEPAGPHFHTCSSAALSATMAGITDRDQLEQAVKVGYERGKGSLKGTTRAASGLRGGGG